MLFKRLLLAATFAGLWAVSASALSTPPSPVFVPQETPGSHLRQMALAALAPNGNEMTATPWDGYWQYVPVNSISAPVNSGAVKNGVYVYGAGVHYYYFQPPTGTSAATATAPNTCPNSPLSGSGYVTDGTSGATYTCIDRLFQTGTVQLSGGYKWQVTNAGTAPYFINTAVTGIACASGVASINITHNIPVSGANNFAAITLTGGTTTEYNGTWYVYPTDSSHLQIVNHVCSAAAASTMPTMTPAGPGNGAGQRQLCLGWRTYLGQGWQAGRPRSHFGQRRQYGSRESLLHEQ